MLKTTSQVSATNPTALKNLTCLSFKYQLYFLNAAKQPYQTSKEIHYYRVFTQYNT